MEQLTEITWSGSCHQSCFTPACRSLAPWVRTFLMIFASPMGAQSPWLSHSKGSFPEPRASLLLWSWTLSLSSPKPTLMLQHLSTAGLWPGRSWSNGTLCCTVSKSSTRGERKGEDSNIGLKISPPSFILIASVRQSSWYGLGLLRTLGSIKHPLAEPWLPLHLPLSQGTHHKSAGRGGNCRAVLGHTYTVGMPCGASGFTHQLWRPAGFQDL